MKKISIALATYNGEKYLHELLESLYCQSYRPYEVVACDDRSTDNTVDILRKFSKKFGLHYQVNDGNIGYIKNFEKTISLCSGDYIALCDQDDCWHSDKLQCLADGMGGHSLICSDVSLIDGSGNKISGSYRKYKRIHVPPRNRQTRSLVFDNYVMGCTALFNRNIFSLGLFPFPEGVFHDWWIAVIASMKDGIKYIKKPLVDYRLHGNNTVGAMKKSFFKDVYTYRERLRTGQNHSTILTLAKWSSAILEELEKRDLIDSWLSALKRDLNVLLDDYNTSFYHPKANLVILKYLNYFCPTQNPFFKIMYMIENMYK